MKEGEEKEKIFDFSLTPRVEKGTGKDDLRNLGTVEF